MNDVARGHFSVDDVGKRIPNAAGGVPIVDGCSFDVPSGSFTAIVGPSGCGKTTLVHLMAGYERPTSGRIAMDGVEVRGPAVDRLVVFQESRLFPWMTVLENVCFGIDARGATSAADARDRGRDMLATVGLHGVAERFPGQLSGGMQRRAELARALINAPAAMLLDEPFRGLDAMTRKLMQAHVCELFEREPRTHIFVTSELEEAVFLADRLVLMTARPMRVRRTIEIDLPRPRRAEMTTGARYRAILSEALEITHEEGARAFARSRAPRA